MQVRLSSKTFWPAELFHAGIEKNITLLVFSFSFSCTFSFSISLFSLSLSIYLYINILFYKIKKSGCTGRVIDTLQNLYSKTTYRVKCNREISDIIWENVGVNQGGNASPILFRSYLSDIKDYLDEYTGICTSNEIILHMLWADDL